ncbi:MAG TPA: hypothetical protein ENJ29_11385 [Bacteroidetes bacterium]|nr:hypothetical protein [Bacteroidota bacterium]
MKTRKRLALGAMTLLVCAGMLTAQERPPQPPPPPPDAPAPVMGMGGQMGRMAQGKGKMNDARQRGALLNEKSEQETLAWIEEADAELAADLAKLKTESPQRYRITIRRMNMTRRKLDRLRERDQERFALQKKIHIMEAKTRMLGTRYRKSDDDAEKERLQADLKKILTELFDLREQDRGREVQRLEKELARLRQSLEKRRKNKERIIERRLAELTGMTDDLRWD